MPSDPSSLSPDGSAPSIQITVVSLTPCQRGNLKAFCDVRFGKWLTVKGFRVVQQPGHAAWCGLPSNFRDDEDSAPGATKKRWFPLVEMPESWKRAAEVAVLAAWDEYDQTGILPSAVIGGQGQ
ncbi:hypothetical protein [Armatimonas sp.]|uniref:hypothetical protein n=1 Tax=Armatimonas sp. TaxID=1872638 RepID=UPI00286D534F|nr:hypothetical protein [Armatimonas sp.]